MFGWRIDIINPEKWEDFLIFKYGFNDYQYHKRNKEKSK